MDKRSYSTSYLVAAAPERVFEAINSPEAWWMTQIQGQNAAVDDEFGYRVEGVHHVRMQVAELVPASRVVWRVVDNWMGFIQDQSEWVGTLIRFELSEKDGGTELVFTHEGLVPEYECFDVCVNSWAMYINGSLKELILTARGRPSSSETAVEHAEEHRLNA